MNYKNTKFKLIFRIISLILIQTFMTLDFVWAGSSVFNQDENHPIIRETLSPSLSLNNNNLQEIFSLVPSSEKSDADIDTSLTKGIQEKRDKNLREKYGRILHWTQEGGFLESISLIATNPIDSTVSKEMIKEIMIRLKSHHPLGKIVSKGEVGDRFVVFEVPGISREGFGIKDLNDIFGYELNTQLIQLRSQILYEKMLKKGLIKNRGDHVYSTYKEDVYLISRNLKIELPVLKEILNEVKEELVSRIDEIIKEKQLYREKFEQSTGKIKEQEKIVYAINMGISGEIAQDSDEARLQADINAHQAISFGGDNSFAMKDYIATIDKIDKLREELINDTSIFQHDDINKDIYFLKQDITNILRKNKKWKEFSDQEKAFFGGNENNFRKAQQYFSYLRLQDYIKKWQVNPDLAKQRSQEISDIVRQLQSVLNHSDSEDKDVKDKNLRGLFERAYNILSTEGKEPSLSSAFLFHGNAPRMKRPVAITLDIKNMGLMNLKSFEVELQLISRAIKKGDYDEVQRLWQSAADGVTIDLQKVMHLTKNLLSEKLKPSNIVELVGGDEFTLILDEESVGKDELAQVLQYIKRYVQLEFNIGLRVCATLAINKFRVDFSYKEDMRNQFAHAKALTELDDGIELLKADEAKGNHNTIRIQDAAGLPRTYEDTDIIPEHDYGDEDAVTREFSQLDEQIFQGKITETLKELLEKYSEQKEPINVVMVGGGRFQDVQLEQYLNSFGENRFRLISVAKESLAPLASSTVVSDMDQGLGIASGKAAVVIVGDVVAPYFYDKVASLHEAQRLLTEDGKAFISDFGLVEVEDNQGESYDFKLPMLEVISRIIYKRNLSDDTAVLEAVVLDKNTQIPSLEFKRAAKITDLGDADKYQSIYDLNSEARESLDILRDKKMAQKETAYLQKLLTEKGEQKAGQTLKRYKGDPILELGRVFALRTMIESSLRKVIMYHNEGHVNKLLGFFDSLFKFIPFRDKKQASTLARFAIFTHDLGYFDDSAEFVRIGHEQRSKEKVLEFAKKYPEVFSKLEISAILYMIDKTVMKIGDAVDDETARDNEAYKILEKLNAGEEIQDMSLIEGYVKENFPQADLSKEADRNLILDTIWAGKVIAVADLWSQAEFDARKQRYLDTESLADAIFLNEEFLWDRRLGDTTSPAAATDLGLAEATEGFHKYFAEVQRLNYYLRNNVFPELGIQRILELEHQDKINKGKELESLISGRQAMLQASAQLKKEDDLIRSGFDEQGEPIIDFDSLKEVKGLKDIIVSVEGAAEISPSHRNFANLLLGELESFIETGRNNQDPNALELDLLDALEKTDLWNILSAEEKKELWDKGAFKIVNYFGGDEILIEGEIPDSQAENDGMFIVLAGKLEVYKTGLQVDKPLLGFGYHVATLAPGDVFGEMATVEKGFPRNATIKVPDEAGKVKVVRISANELKKLYDTNSQLRDKLDYIIKTRKNSNSLPSRVKSHSQGLINSRNESLPKIITVDQAI